MGDCAYPRTDRWQSVVRTLFLRRLEFALRTAVAMLLGAVLALHPYTRPWWGIPFFVPLIAVASVGRTFGGTLAASYYVSRSSLLLAIVRTS